MKHKMIKVTDINGVVWECLYIVGLTVRKPICQTCFQEMDKGIISGSGSGSFWSCSGYMWAKPRVTSACPRWLGNFNVDNNGTVEYIEQQTLPQNEYEIRVSKIAKELNSHEKQEKETAES